MTWRDDANKVIEAAIEEIGDEFICPDDVDEIFKRISKEYYPFGERSMWPYKVWLSAIQKNKAEYLHRTKMQEPMNYNTGMFSMVQDDE